MTEIAGKHAHWVQLLVVLFFVDRFPYCTILTIKMQFHHYQKSHPNYTQCARLDAGFSDWIASMAAKPIVPHLQLPNGKSKAIIS